MDDRTPQQVEFDQLILTRVRNGMALLNEKYGEDWVDKFTEEDMKTLRLSSGSACVLGKLDAKEFGGGDPNYEGDYSHFAHKILGLDTEDNEDVEYGFCLSGTVLGGGWAWDHLTDAWRVAIQARKVSRDRADAS